MSNQPSGLLVKYASTFVAGRLVEPSPNGASVGNQTPDLRVADSTLYH